MNPTLNLNWIASPTSLASRGILASPALSKTPMLTWREPMSLPCRRSTKGFGNVVAEAIATGTAVVSTDCESGPAEILGHGRYGKLAPVGDAAALATAIAETLDNPPDAEVLKARATAFTVETIVNQYLTVIQRAMASPRLAAA